MYKMFTAQICHPGSLHFYQLCRQYSNNYTTEQGCDRLKFVAIDIVFVGPPKQQENIQQVEVRTVRGPTQLLGSSLEIAPHRGV